MKPLPKSVGTVAVAAALMLVSSSDSVNEFTAALGNFVGRPTLGPLIGKGLLMISVFVIYLSHSATGAGGKDAPVT